MPEGAHAAPSSRRGRLSLAPGRGWRLVRARAALLYPGVALAVTIAVAATFLSEHYGAPVMLFALLIGMVFHFLSEGGRCVAGVDFTARRLLRLGVALLGVRITLADIASLGPTLAVLIPCLILATLAAGIGLARLFGRTPLFGLLTGGAVAICGASAALAIAAVLPRRGAEADRDTLFTVIAVTSLSTLAMIFYPILFRALGLDDVEAGLLVGATIHDVAQVVGAGYAISEEAGDVATFVKLTRVAALPVVVIALALWFSRSGNAGATFPWFAVAFAVLLAVNSLGLIPEPVRVSLDTVSRWLLVAAIAALGVKTSLKAMTELGARPVLLVTGETLVLLALALAAVMLLA